MSAAVCGAGQREKHPVRLHTVYVHFCGAGSEGQGHFNDIMLSSLFLKERNITNLFAPLHILLIKEREQEVLWRTT